MKILCICPIGIGNYLLMYPACKIIKETHPDWELYLLGLRTGLKDFANKDSLWTDTIIFDPTTTKLYKSDSFKILFKLQKYKFDASINFFPTNKWLYNVLPWLALIKKRYSFYYKYNPITKLSFLSNRKIPVNLNFHDVEHNIAMAEAISKIKKQNYKYSFPKLFTNEDLEWAHNYLNKINIKKFLAIHPGSSAEHGMILKRWAPNKFSELADYICKKLNLSVLIFGATDENELKKIVFEKISVNKHIVSQISLSKTSALLYLSKLSLCNDSGLMHIASCMNIPTIAIFGPTDERRNGPVGTPSIVVRKNTEGFPLWTVYNVGNRKIPRNINPKLSLENVSVDYAIKQIKPWLEQHISDKV